MVSSTESAGTTEDTTLYQVVTGNAPSTASEEWTEDLTSLDSELTETESVHENPMILDSSDMTSFSPDAERLMAGADEERNERLYAGGVAGTTTVQSIRTLPDGRVEEVEDVEVVEGKRRSTKRTIRVSTPSKSRGSRRSHSRSSKRSRSISRSVRNKRSKSVTRNTTSTPNIALLPLNIPMENKKIVDKKEVKKIYSIPISVKRLREVVDYYDSERENTIVHLMASADDVLIKYVVKKK